MDKSGIELHIYKKCPYELTDVPIVEGWHIDSELMVDEHLTEVFSELTPLGLYDLAEGCMEYDQTEESVPQLQAKLEHLGFNCKLMD